MLKTIKEKKSNIEVLVSLGAGDLENDIAEMKNILTDRKC